MACARPGVAALVLRARSAHPARTRHFAGRGCNRAEGSIDSVLRGVSRHAPTIPCGTMFGFTHAPGHRPGGVTSFTSEERVRLALKYEYPGPGRLFQARESPAGSRPPGGSPGKP